MMAPVFSTRTVLEEGRPLGYMATVLLPSNSPVLRVEGEWQGKKKAAVASCCLAAVRKLHEARCCRGSPAGCPCDVPAAKSRARAATGAVIRPAASDHGSLSLLVLMGRPSPRAWSVANLKLSARSLAWPQHQSRLLPSQVLFSLDWHLVREAGCALGASKPANAQTLAPEVSIVPQPSSNRGLPRAPDPAAPKACAAARRSRRWTTICCQ